MATDNNSPQLPSNGFQSPGVRRVWWWILATVASVILLGAVPMDIRIPRPDSADEDHPKEDALFSHTSHSSFKCYSCHPSIFPTAKVTFTHDDMDEGQYCGSCHNDRTAFSPDAPGVSCTTCHQKD
ncbi:MAG: hypothetical protein HUU55_23780 [Myxococcales bacterium]|nr:hypothetical protein [Myxococcales bacterium]